jgi:hypothetical protein
MLHFLEPIMLTAARTARLLLVSLILWFVATAYIRWIPGAFTDPVRGPLGFVTTFPMAWASVWLVRRLVAPGQLLAGVALVGAVAMMIDGAALRFFPAVYGTDEFTLRLGAAWLLWGYGVSLGIALIWAERETSPSARVS